jgi:L-threonylcarbamoyladenylate synthase
MQPIHTRRLFVNAVEPERDVILAAADHIRAGNLVAFPTETVYGLGANALDAAAVQRIFTAKGRPASDPLIIHLHDVEQLALVVSPIPPIVQELASQFWPGPLTLILPRHPRVPAEVTAGRNTVAVRIPRHPVALALLDAARTPIAAPSANRFARPSPTTAQHVLEDLDGRIEVVLDAGPAPIGLESTIVDVTQTPPALLRPGGTPAEALRALLPDMVVREHFLAPESTAPAPGAFLKHYAPRAELRLFDGPRLAVLAHMWKTARQLVDAEHAAVGVLAVDEDRAAFNGLPVQIATLGPAENLDAVGRRLFAGLRELDQSGVGVILARLPAREGLGLAIWDRLFRAAEGRVIEVKG